MTQDLLVDIGEEYFVTNNVDGATLTVGLYNDSSDNLAEGSNVGNITTEPQNGSAYATVSVTFTASNIGGNWGVENDAVISYDFSDTTDDSVEVDTAFVTANFDSTAAGSQGEHLIANPALSQSRKVGSIDTLEIGAGDLELKLE
jgi:predicted RNA-binding protein (virulence factor B family)